MAATINVALLRAALEDATANPDTHDMSEWARRTNCGTTYCIATRIAIMTGHELNWQVGIDDYSACTTVDGRSICDVAIAEAGLTETQAEYLFAVRNSLLQAWEIAAEINAGAIVVPASLADLP